MNPSSATKGPTSSLVRNRPISSDDVFFFLKFQYFRGAIAIGAVQPSGSKFWRLKYRFDGKEKLLSFGKYPGISLAAAREKRRVAKAPACGRDRSLRGGCCRSGGRGMLENWADEIARADAETLAARGASGRPVLSPAPHRQQPFPLEAHINRYASGPFG
ncbi:Arm DNA-binding domain-containing protein [Sphingomonas mali]|uniref:Arm DNA-binding domain-containing protein n=1 Tax=Sphingomonas mali TaxID=40682 RepID=UPI000B13600D|nr:Arm DNA-binding domain-containing protein [Sphingomonas mali]